MPKKTKTKNKKYILGPFQEDVFSILTQRPMTAGEVAELYASRYHNTPRGRNECAKRITELTKMGLVKNTGKIIFCPVTGYKATVWKATTKRL
jgi:hypothetical protein